MPVTGDLDPINIFAPPGHPHLWFWIASGVCALLAVVCLITAARPWKAWLYRYSVLIAALGLVAGAAAFALAVTAIFLR